MSREKTRLDEPSGINSLTYRCIPGYEGSRAQALAKLRCQSGDLELVPWDVVRQGRLRFGIRWDRCRSWLCFAFDDGFLVDGGNLETSFRH